jgi:hypothetical protein
LVAEKVTNVEKEQEADADILLKSKATYESPLINESKVINGTVYLFRLYTIDSIDI